MRKDKVKGSAEEVVALKLREAIAPFSGKTSDDSLRMCDEAVAAIADKHPRSYALLQFIQETRMSDIHSRTVRRNPCVWHVIHWQSTGEVQETGNSRQILSHEWHLGKTASLQKNI